MHRAYRSIYSMDHDDISNVTKELDDAKEGDTVLHLNYKCLKEMPQCLLSDATSFKHLKKIYMKRNLLTSMPENLHQLSNLVELYLHSNNIRFIPEGICSLKMLESLNLCCNQLEQLPVCLGKLTSLQKLQISENRLSSLPSSIGNLKNLKTLEAMRNDLTDFPVNLCSCESLVILNLDYNKLVTVPRQVKKLKFLSELSLCGNNLVVLPQTFALYASDSSLKYLLVGKNPTLHCLPASVKHLDVGNFKSCASTDPFGILPGAVELVVSYKRKISIPVVLPPEINSINTPDDCVASLQELAYRSSHLLVSCFGGTAEFMDLVHSLPPTLTSLLLEPTAKCPNCLQEVFIKAFPMVMKNVDQSVTFVGLCCSIKCVVQFVDVATTILGLAVVYPSKTDLPV